MFLVGPFIPCSLSIFLFLFFGFIEHSFWAQMSPKTHVYVFGLGPFLGLGLKWARERERDGEGGPVVEE